MRVNTPDRPLGSAARVSPARRPFQRSPRRPCVSLVPLGPAGPWLFGGLGFAATLLSVILAFIPPAGTSSPVLFVIKIAGATLLFIAVGLIFYWRGRRR